MKKFLLSIVLFSLFSFKSFGHVDHYANFNFLEYELFRNNKPIGYHKYDFNRDSDNLSITSEVSFKIVKLGVELYKYYAKSVENYKNSEFISYSSKTKQNKKDRYVNIRHDTNIDKLLVDIEPLPGIQNGIEIINNLDKVPSHGATIVVGQPKIQGGSGGPNRVMALI